MVKMAKEFGFDVVEPGVELKWVPTAEELKKCFEFGQQIAQKIKA
jgi:flavorubredoxin